MWTWGSEEAQVSLKPTRRALGLGQPSSTWSVWARCPLNTCGPDVLTDGAQRKPGGGRPPTQSPQLLSPLFLISA